MSREMSVDKELAFRIVLTNPPPGVMFGLQKGRGANYETIERQESKSGDLRFGFTIGLKGSRKDKMPDFTGPLVQGAPGERFLYIDIGTYAGQHDSSWGRRLKIPLNGITWD